MKFLLSSLVLFSVVVAVSQAVRLGGAPDLISKPGECVWGLPRDGRFSSCKLGDWKIGRTLSHKAVNESEIEFSEDFAFKWGEDQLVASDANASCSATLPPNAVLYQRMTDDILYAHYRLRACGRVLGDTPCTVVVKTARNEIYDKLEFRPDDKIECSSSGSDSEEERECVNECTSAIEEIKIRYVGLQPARVRVRAPDVGIVEWVEAGEFVHGDEATYNLTNIAEWFNNTIDFFPDIELSTHFGNYSVLDAVSFNCTSLSLVPGKRLGDARQFLVVSLTASEGPLCSRSDLSKRESECKCDKSRDAKEVCLFSDKGFVADPAEEFYIGLESESCGCSFDNICLEQVNAEEGYFGLDWILHDMKSDDNAKEEDDDSSA